jgi:hypothetical protein
MKLCMNVAILVRFGLNKSPSSGLCNPKPGTPRTQFRKLCSSPVRFGADCSLTPSVLVLCLYCQVCSYVGFDVFTALTVMNAVFCDVASCGFIIDRRFGIPCRLHLQSRINNAREGKCYTVINRLTTVQRH